MIKAPGRTLYELVAYDQEVFMNNNKNSPREFWSFVKIRAEKNLTEINNLSVREDDLLEWHQEEVSSLASLVKEQAVDHP